MRERKIGELILDFDVYPRVSIDTTHVGYMAEAEKGGAKFPPLVICAKSRRIVDGFHRHKVYMTRYGADYVVEVIEKRYRNDQELFLDSMRLNASHGRTLTRFDRVHCMLRAEVLKLTVEETASALSMPVDVYQELRVGRVAGTKQELTVPLKNTIRHMHGKTLTQAQEKANESLSGMNQVFYVNQVILLIDNNLLDLDNEKLMERLAHLSSLLRKLKQLAA